MIANFRCLTFVRSYHVTTRCNAADKPLLSKLRKTTGFSFLNCRQALEKFNNDIKQAESWLREQAQKEGWAKASKLQGRPMSQGLIGLTVNDKVAAMVEVNCETDFVARNVKFQNFVSLVTRSFLQYGIAQELKKIVMNSNSIGSLLINEQSVSDLTALEVGQIGENIAVRRGIFLHASYDQFIASYVHATGPKSQPASVQQCSMGKYGSLLLYRHDPVDPTTLEKPMTHGEIGRQLCQHIVGMNPQAIGSYDDAPCESRDDETKLVHQEYMLDTSLTVGNVLMQNGITAMDFVRLECGENLLDEGQENRSSTCVSATVGG